MLVWSQLSYFVGRRVWRRDGNVFEVPPIRADCNGGWRVPCDDVSGEGDNVSVKRALIRVGEGFFLLPIRIGGGGLAL